MNSRNCNCCLRDMNEVPSLKWRALHLWIKCEQKGSPTVTSCWSTLESHHSSLSCIEFGEWSQSMDSKLLLASFIENSPVYWNESNEKHGLGLVMFILYFVSYWQRENLHFFSRKILYLELFRCVQLVWHRYTKKIFTRFLMYKSCEHL